MLVVSDNFNIAITEDNKLYSWGHNGYGQLGLGYNLNQDKPQLVDFFKDKNVNKIICGSYQTFAILDDGSVYSWGFNYNGQLGLGHYVNQKSRYW